MTAATAVKERPILFSGAMVRAILAGTKSQTRRVMKPQPDLVDASGLYWNIGGYRLRSSAANPIKCPYGVSGDQLWVRETFQPIFAEGFEHGRDPSPDWKTGFGYAPRYIATDGRTEWLDGDDGITDRCKPAIFMPRWASRMTLEVTDVRVQRVQEISEEDARAEGCDTSEAFATTCKGAYAILWDDINGKRPGCAWPDNPWTWAITFRRIA